MSHFHVTAVLGNGATVLFGVRAEDEDAALCLARVRVSWSGHPVDRLEVTPLRWDRIAPVQAGRPGGETSR